MHSVARPSITFRHVALLLVGLVLMLVAPIRATATSPVPAEHPVDTALSALSAATAPTPAPVYSLPLSVPAPPDRMQRISALAARVIDARVRAALPPTMDLGATRAPSTIALKPTPRTADLFGEPRDPSVDVSADGSITGASVAIGAPDVGRRGGIGPATIGTSGSGSTASAVITGSSELPTHTGFTVVHDTTGTGTIHASIQPLDRPG